MVSMTDTTLVCGSAGTMNQISNDRSPLFGVPQLCIAKDSGKLHFRRDSFNTKIARQAQRHSLTSCEEFWSTTDGLQPERQGGREFHRNASVKESVQSSQLNRRFSVLFSIPCSSPTLPVQPTETTCTWNIQHD
ncbi:hypothetical protein BaRGS_00003917 [Batillaria attramentaria]|uniref:Uncharacterized protein n=1 Tax=Batillaria attramentaria TaxID=370345 RepID=A0ABD0LYV2_9CAEN